MNLLSVILCLFIKITLAIKLENRIVGGVNVTIEDYPFMVSQRILNKHTCGGTILSKNFILTAAHCVEKWVNHTQYLSIQYGVTEINENGPNVINIKNIIIHENFSINNAGYYHDLAIIELENDIPFGKDVQPIELADTNDEIPDLGTTSLLGWGLAYTGGPQYTNLQYTEIAAYSDFYCESLEPNYNPNYHFCGGLLEGGAGHCSGDSGGPAIINGKQFGVISWSVKPCASLGNPGIFVRIPSYRMWIRTHTSV